MKKTVLFINGHLDVGGCERSLVDILKNFDYNQDYSYTPKNVMKLLKKERVSTPQQFVQDYASFIKTATKEDLKKLRNNVLTGTAKRINIDGINVYGLTATDYKLDNPDEGITNMPSSPF